jgi:purine-nucleoside/S-methyl-5'-thioadenosine phosphorylase / adenosine deaminase
MRPSRDGGVTLHEFELLTGHSGLIAGCSDRAGGVSRPPYDELNVGLHVGDDPEAVIENRRRVVAAIGADLDALAMPLQVHKGDVAMVTAADRGRGARSLDDAIANTDAIVTDEPGVVLAVMLADCVPVIVFDPVTPAVGVAHAGWAGTVNHVTRNTVDALARCYGSNPADLLAGVGPSIGPASYEVGDDVAQRARAAFPAVDVVRPTGNGKYLFDLWESNVADLVAAGVPRANIEVAGIDTFDSTDRFFSHRRQRPTGRFMALACLRGAAA